MARRDLEADDKMSLFKLTPRVDRKDDSLHVAPALEEVDPEK